ncbi:MAG: NAD(P)/FAD-dependent oxidoreductase [Myxococcales bacterium]|nr:NAD(P)/FAD-dependent oxidoreductase [Myxococcales bacterium]
MGEKSEPQRRPHVVIIGGGFGGLEAARTLRRAPVRVTLVDRRNHHLFQPLLYQVATAGLTGPDIAAPIRRILRRQRNATVLLAEVIGVDVDGRRVHLRDGELAYDYLIVAAGAGNFYFGHDEWARHAPGLKSIEDALEVRGRVLYAFEAAEREADAERRRACLTFVVVGGGPTGVELAGALAEIGKHTLSRDFRNFNPADARVVLIEGGPRLLAGMDARLAEEARRQLVARGVDVRLSARVETIDAEGVVFGGERIAARTVLWAAGVRASPLAEMLGAPLERGRVRVEPDLSLPGHPEVFVVGDMAALQQDGAWLPGVAQVALQGGHQAARNLLRRQAGAPTEPFHYRDKGSMATIGRSAAVAEVGRLRTTGIFAWVLWWLVHIVALIGFRNRVVVMLEWIWAYLSWQRSARVIVTQPALPAAEEPGDGARGSP